MPFYRNISDRGAWGGIWNITESFEEMCAMLPSGSYHHTYALQRFASLRRRLEYVAVRLLVYTLTGKEYQIDYLPSGHPYIRDGRMRISISHTVGYAAVLFSDTADIGIDIERYSERIVRLKERLIGPMETADSTYSILLHWSAKEAVFKILDKDGIDFRANFQVCGLLCAATVEHTDSKGMFSMSYHLDDGTEGNVEITYETTSEFVLTYAVVPD